MSKEPIDGVIINMDNPNMYREMTLKELKEEINNLEKNKIIEALELLKFGQLQE